MIGYFVELRPNTLRADGRPNIDAAPARVVASTSMNPKDRVRTTPEPYWTTTGNFRAWVWATSERVAERMARGEARTCERAA